MKKCFVIGLIMALVPQVGAIAAQKTVDMLIAEKQAKIKKLEKCKGTTKDLKIAGISTLGITAVGVGANIAEAVVLNDYKDKVSKEKTELAKEQQANLDLKAQAQAKAVADAENQKQAAIDAERAKICRSFGAEWKALGAKDDFCVKTIDAEVEVAKIPEEIQKINGQCKYAGYSNLTDAKQGFWRAQCQGIDVLFDFKNPKCPAKQEFNGDTGECVAEEQKVCTPACKEDQVCKNGKCVAKAAGQPKSNKGQYTIADRVKGELTAIRIAISDYLVKQNIPCSGPKYEFVSDKTYKVICEDNSEYTFNLTGLYCDSGYALSNGLCKEDNTPIQKVHDLEAQPFLEVFNIIYDKLPQSCRDGGNYNHTKGKKQWTVQCKNTTHIFNFKDVICDSGEVFDLNEGICKSNAPKDTKTVRVSGTGGEAFEKEVPITPQADENVSIFSDVRAMSSNQAIALARVYMKFNQRHDDVCNPDKNNSNTIRCSNLLFKFASFSESNRNKAAEGIAKSVCEIHGRIFRDHVCQQANQSECMSGTSSVYGDIQIVNPSMAVTYANGECRITW